MSGHSASNEVFGTKVLTIAIIVGSVFLLLAMLASPAPKANAEQIAQVQQPAAVETVVVTATAPAHAS